jgi:hypothetical protein
MSRGYYLSRQTFSDADGRPVATLHHRKVWEQLMPTIAFAAPLLPGMTELDREVMTSFQTGERKSDYEDARRRAGITSEKVWIQTTPAGDMAIVYLEADDLDAAFTALGKSDEPFDRWFRDHVQRVHGFSLADDFHAPEQVLDFRA